MKQLEPGNTFINKRCAVRANGATQQVADLCRRHGGIMRIGRAVIIPTILALSAAGSILASSAAPVAAAQAPAAHVQAATSSMQPHLHYHD
jgi:hypothetical protein